MKEQQSCKAWTFRNKETGKFVTEYFDGTPLLFKTKKEASYEKRDYETVVKVEIKELA